MERRWFLGNPEKKERERRGGAGKKGDKNVDREDTRREEAERVEATRRKETSVDPGDAGRGRDKDRPEQLRQGAAGLREEELQHSWRRMRMSQRGGSSWETRKRRRESKLVAQEKTETQEETRT
ncbi:hypothetical protein NDU88_001232 [Pleurodeles waltl]|uniref:Uncharacterized protein n=1 Tax=Pleurodeles waltl TaxID=8319 RepID=A0AAV7UVG2_PLEWA|nr:hypothetical protein NDU88_001232 [Pleurodeles waltl]